MMSLAKMVAAQLPVIAFVQPLVNMKKLSVDLSKLAKHDGYLPVIAQYIPVEDDPRGAMFFVLCKANPPSEEEIAALINEIQNEESEDEDTDASESPSEKSQENVFSDDDKEE